MAKMQSMLIKANGQNAKSVSKDIMKEKGEKEKELNDLDKGYKGGKGGKISGGGKGLNKLGKIMAQSPSIS